MESCQSMLESCRLYDAAVGRADDAAFSIRMGEAQTRHYREWAERFRSASRVRFPTSTATCCISGSEPGQAGGTVRVPAF
jgi:hypothetical protein